MSARSTLYVTANLTIVQVEGDRLEHTEMGEIDIDRMALVLQNVADPTKPSTAASTGRFCAMPTVAGWTDTRRPVG